MDSNVARAKMQPLYLRPLHRNICEFGIVFFGLPGTLNDINVLQRSPLFAKLANGEAPTCNYKVMNNEYTMGYYLADGIYPDWATFVKSVKDPQDRIEAEFAKAQEAARKNIKRAFGVLQARFAIVRGPARFWDKKTLVNIMTTWSSRMKES
jgi:hypothetical protein